MTFGRHKRNCARPTAQSGFQRPAWSLIGLATLAIVYGLTLCGCGSVSLSPRGNTDVGLAARVRLLEAELRRTRVQLDEAKERNLVLEKREQMRRRELDSGELTEAVPVPFAERNSAPKVSVGTKAVVAPPPAREPVVQSVGSAETGEHFLYAKVLETYQKRNVAELQKSTQLLLRTYPDSVFSDNALYLSGMLALELGDMARATSFMDRVLNEYPLGNKAVSALFAKGVIEKRSKKPNEAQRLFLKVRGLYPGSPEAARVGLELELLKVRES